MNARRDLATCARVAACLSLLVACASTPGTSTPGTSTTSTSTTSTATKPSAITLVAYDSFLSEGTSLGTALQAFTASTGITVDVVIGGDAGTMVSKAALTAGNPEGDVMFGVDNTLLSRAIDAGVFEPYRSIELASINPKLTALVPADQVTPVDFGDVCLNYDIAWFASKGIEPPTTLQELAAPAYRNLLVVENPAASSPGLAFLLATVAQFGTDGWQQYWKDLRDNGVEVVESWNDAYYDRFSGSSGHGPRPLVVSYGSSPPAEVIFADPPRADAPTAVISATCFRQVEFAGVLRGTEHPKEAQQLIDFLAGPTFQAEVALNLFVYPARTDIALPPEFTKFSVRPGSPLTVSPADIAANREAWVDEWTSIVLR